MAPIRGHNNKKKTGKEKIGINVNAFNGNLFIGKKLLFIETR